MSQMPKLTTEEIKDWIRPVQDPELFMSLVDLGLIYDCTIAEDGTALIKMTLTSPGCPAGDQMIADLKKRLLENESIKDAHVEIVWDPKWDPKIMATEECKETLGIW